jgi:putative ABC transport system substrate-binding protein
MQAAALIASLPSMALAQRGTPGARAAKVGILWHVERTSDLLGIYRDALIGALSRLGYVDGKTVQFAERHSADLSRLGELARELVDEAPDVLVGGSQLTAVELKKATSTIPIVFATAPNPIGTGLVDSLARPGGNVTGLSIMVVDTTGKRLSLFKEAVPALRRIALIYDSREPAYFTNPSSYADPARALGIDVQPVEFQSTDAIAETFSAVAKGGFDGAIAVGIAPLLERARFGAAASAEKVPTMTFAAECVPYGFLMAYGLDFSDNFRGTAIYVDKILRGAKPADIPVEQPTRLKLVINLKVAKALGLTMPLSLLSVADDVIE